MTKGYWIGRVDVADPQTYKAYIAANASPSKNTGRRFLARSGRCENLEGSGRSRKRPSSSFPVTRPPSTAGTRPNTSTRRHCGIRCPPPTWSSSKVMKGRSLARTIRLETS